MRRILISAITLTALTMSGCWAHEERRHEEEHHDHDHDHDGDHHDDHHDTTARPYEARAFVTTGR
jgi:hypothetical protein